MATLMHTLRHLFSKPVRPQAYGPVTVALRALHAEFGAH